MGSRVGLAYSSRPLQTLGLCFAPARRGLAATKGWRPGDPGRVRDLYQQLPREHYRVPDYCASVLDIRGPKLEPCATPTMGNRVAGEFGLVCGIFNWRRRF